MTDAVDRAWRLRRDHRGPNVEHAVYRAYDRDGVLLYVGCSINPDYRRTAHQRRAPWFPRMTRWVVEWHPNYFAARRAEAAAITSEHPEFNVVLNRRASKPAPGSSVSARSDGPGRSRKDAAA